jgi:1-hydroxycarotenoid 3,4-desaturase
VPEAGVVIIGAGIGGLAAAMDLASRSLPVTVVERAATPGGKARQVEVAGETLDAGPTVFTMRWVFEELFAAAGTRLDRELPLAPLEVLARHAWAENAQLDLHADVDRSEEAIARLCGTAEARRFRRFSAAAAHTYRTLESTYIRAARPNPVDLARRAGVAALWRTRPFASLWQTLGEHFRDPRLIQLFGRYATYCGSSPFSAPATLTLIAHVEQLGVWLPRGGMYALAAAMAGVATRLGVEFRYGHEAREIVVERGQVAGVELDGGERLHAGTVIFNGDVAALAAGRLGTRVADVVPPVSPAERSLSALTWNVVAETSGFSLHRHNVFFSADYPREFDDLFVARRLPSAPTVYLCAQDRPGDRPGRERLLCLVNAPPTGDERSFDPSEIEQCERQSWRQMERCGLRIHPAEPMVVTTPTDFERLFPATGGALYGQASHGWRASFSRPGSRTALPGLYLAGGSTHPGAGVPMAALSGRLAASIAQGDLDSMSRSRAVAMPGGTSMR